MAILIVRFALISGIVFSTLATIVFACSSPVPSAELDVKNGDAGRKRDSGNTGPVGSSPTGPSNDEQLPPPTPPDKKDSGANGDASPSPTDAASPPPPTPFLALDVRFPVDADRYLTQCTPDGKMQLVWTTTAQGDDYSRWASASYKENPGVNYPCGAIANGEYPIVLSWLAPDGVPVGTWIVRCVGNKTSQAYKVTATHAGHPAATFQYPQPYAGCP